MLSTVLRLLIELFFELLSGGALRRYEVGLYCGKAQTARVFKESLQRARGRSMEAVGLEALGIPLEASGLPLGWSGQVGLFLIHHAFDFCSFSRLLLVLVGHSEDLNIFKILLLMLWKKLLYIAALLF